MYILPDRIMYATRREREGGREDGRGGGAYAGTSRGVHKTRTGRIGQRESESGERATGEGKRDRR